MKKTIMLMGFIIWFCLCESLYATVLYSLDFSKVETSDVTRWMEKNGFVFRLDAEDLKLSLESGALVVYNEGDLNGLFVKEVNIENVKRIRIEWGVNKYPQGIDWESGMTRDAIMVLFSFGKEKISSGSFIIPNLPYFIGFFLGEKETDNKPYTGTYYKEGGRYLCTPCNNPPGKTVVTEVEISKRFLEFFSKKTVPPISSISIETDSRDLGAAEAFIKKIELLSD